MTAPWLPHFIPLVLLALCTGRSESCDGFVCQNGQCLSSIFDRCDGIIECTDGSDEINCLACPSGYSCTNDQCTSFISDRCNEMCDCTDCSDESNCTPLNVHNSVVAIAVGVSVSVLVVFVCIPICVVLIIVGVVVGAVGRKRSHNKRQTQVAGTGYVECQEDPTTGSSETPLPGYELPSTAAAVAEHRSQPAYQQPPGVAAEPVEAHVPQSPSVETTNDQTPILQN